MASGVNLKPEGAGAMNFWYMYFLTKRDKCPIKFESLGSQKVKVDEPGKDSIVISVPPWFLIKIIGASQMEPLILMNIITMKVTAVTPIGYCKDGKNVSFYTDDFQAAVAMHKFSSKIFLSLNTELNFLVTPIYKPVCEWNDAVKRKITAVVLRRCVANKASVHLGSFHKDNDLTSEFFCPLTNPVIFTAVLDVLGMFMPDVLDLNLSYNKLRTLAEIVQAFKSHPKLNPQTVTKLNLQGNWIQYMSDLTPIKDFDIVSLHLLDNPIREAMDDNILIRDLKQMCPKLLNLDGRDIMYYKTNATLVSTLLPKNIQITVQEETPKATEKQVQESVPVTASENITTVASSGKRIPIGRKEFFCRVQGQEFAARFIEHFFTLYDSSSRENMQDIYHESATFSLSAAFEASNVSWLAHYDSVNRNLLKLQNSMDKMERLCMGRNKIIELYAKLPKTKHEKSTFSVDLVYFTENFIFLSVTGVFRESERPGAQLKSFSRVFVIISSGNSMCIVNELFYVSNATSDQIKALFQTSSPKMPIEVSDEEEGGKTPESWLYGYTKYLLIETIVHLTSMRRDWSLKCLQENDWDLEKAMFVFNDLHDRGMIPEVAFTKG